MKIAVNRLIRDEKGAAMVLALVMLVIGGLVSAPLLSHMGTGIVTGEVYEVRTAELYAADAGVEDAVWNIQHEVPEVAGLTQCSQHWSYNITDVNGKSVDVTITLMTIVDDLPFDYCVESTATGDGSETEIEAYIAAESKYGDYVGILHNVLTSQGEIELSPGVNITPSEGEHSPIDYYGGVWPEIWELEDFYGQQVKDETPYPFGTIDLNGADMDLGPLYRDGELDIVNSSNTPATLTLTGTIYITGDTDIGKTGKDFALDLNDQIIFVASNTSDPQKALEIGGKCTIEGPGVIIAVGDIYFAPKGDVGSDEEPVFVFSVLGETTLQPMGDFYGSVAGSVLVDLQPNTSINYPETEGWYGGLNFLIGVQQLIYSIYSWEIIQQ